MSGSGSVNRREFLTGAFRGRNVALATAAGLAWTHVVEAPDAKGAPRRPPGAQEERDFVATCTKCGLCVEACPFDTLKLATAGDPQPIGTPFFEPRETPCYMCEDPPCIAACPTDSLVKDTKIEDARMGLAVLIDQENCLAHQGLRCEVCYRACPLMGQSITLEFRSQEPTGMGAFFVPIVHSEYCTGCGKCENACVIEEAAIRVLPVELAKGKLGPHYRFEGEQPESIRDAPTPRPAPEREAGLDHLLDSMNDLSGIEKP